MLKEKHPVAILVTDVTGGNFLITVKSQLPRALKYLASSLKKIRRRPVHLENSLPCNEGKAEDGRKIYAE